MAYLAGSSARDITPPVGTPLAGRPKAHPTYSIHDPLQAKALYLKQEETAVVLISVDLLLIERTESDPIRQAVAARLDLPIDAVVLCCTHTHTGPGVGNWFPWEGREAYEIQLNDAITAAATGAKETAQPAKITCASAQCANLSHNRRYVMADGRVLTHPPKENARHPDGPIDPEVQTIFIQSPENHPIAMVVGFACHPTAMGIRDNAISADFPHWVETAIQKATRANIPVLFIPGALGDQSDGDPFIRSQQVGVGLAKHIGETIGREAFNAQNIHPIQIDGALNLTATDVQIPTIDMGPARQTWAKEVLQNPKAHHDTDVRDARMILEMCTTWPEHVQTRLPLIAIGDLALYGIPGELFCWYGLQLKAQSRFAHPMVLGLANDRIGYIADRVFPTKDIFNKPLDFDNRPFGQTGDAGEILVQATLTL